MHVRQVVYRDFMSDLHSLLRAGIPITEALANLASATSGTGGYRDFAECLLERIEESVPLSEALAAYPAIVPAVDVALVRAGERSGRLDQVLESIVTRVDASIELRRDLLRRSAYNIFLTVMMVALMPLSLVFTGRLLSYLLIQVVFFGGVFSLIAIVRRGLDRAAERPAMSEAFERFVFAIPWWGKQQVKLALAVMFEVLGVVLEAGLTVGEAVPLAAGTTRWPGLRRTVLEAGVAMESGESVDDAFRSIEQYMEGTWRRRLAAAQYAGRTDRGFLELAIVWKSEFRRSVENFLRILPIFVLLIVGGVILAWALSTIGGMYDQVLLR